MVEQRIEKSKPPEYVLVRRPVGSGTHTALLHAGQETSAIWGWEGDQRNLGFRMGVAGGIKKRRRWDLNP